MSIVFVVISYLLLLCGMVTYSHSYLLCLRIKRNSTKIEGQGLFLVVYIFISCMFLLISMVKMNFFVYVGIIMGVIGLLVSIYYYKMRKEVMVKKARFKKK